MEVVLLVGPRRVTLSGDDILDGQSSWEEITFEHVLEAFLKAERERASNNGKWPMAAELKLVVKGKVRALSDPVLGALSEKEKKGIVEKSQSKPVSLKGRLTFPPAFASCFEEKVQEKADTGVTSAQSTETHGKGHQTLEQLEERKKVDPATLAPGAILITVQQGSEKYEVVATNDKFTIGEIKLNLQSQMAVPPKQQKLLLKGKIRQDDAETLIACGITGSTCRAKVMFEDGYHQAVDGSEFLLVAEEELRAGADLLNKIESQLAHRLVSDPAEYIVQIDGALDRLENVSHYLGSRSVKMADADRKVKALEEIETIRSKLVSVKKYRVRGQR